MLLVGFGVTLLKVYNPIAAFGILDDAGRWQNAFFVAAVMGISVFIVHQLRNLTLPSCRSPTRRR